jgi:gluconolactonase
VRIAKRPRVFARAAFPIAAAARVVVVVAVAVVPAGCGTTTAPPPGVVSAPAAAPAGAIATSPARAIPSTIPFVSLEGPFWVASGGYLIFSDVVEQNGTAAKIYRYDPGTRAVSVVPYPVAPTSTNGLAVDGQGRLLACERWNGALARIDGAARAVVADRAPGADGRSLNAPNDLTVRADGNIYFTDTKWGARPGDHAPLGVYRVAPDGAISVAFRVDMPNGVVLSPDGRTLYVGSDAQDRLWRLPVAADGTVGAAAPFVAAHQVPGGKLHVPDGLCVDDRGRIYVTNNSDEVSAIDVFESDGRFAGQIAIPAPPSNCTFGGADRRTLYVTTLHAVYELRVETPGLP